jgi:hypothetical protein
MKTHRSGQRPVTIENIARKIAGWKLEHREFHHGECEERDSFTTKNARDAKTPVEFVLFASFAFFVVKNLLVTPP